MNLVKKGNIPEAEDSFKEAASLADSVVDEIAKDVIQTQVIISSQKTIKIIKNLKSKFGRAVSLKIFFSWLKFKNSTTIKSNLPNRK